MTKKSDSSFGLTRSSHIFRHYLEVLRTISLDALSESTSEKCLSKLVKIVSSELYWDVCSIYLLEPENKELILAASYGLSSNSVGNIKLPIVEGLVGFAVREEESIFIENAQSDPRYKYFPETEEEKYLSLSAVPFYKDGKVSGVLTVQTIKPYKFSTADRHFLDILASQIGQAVDAALSLKILDDKKDALVLLGKPASSGVGKARVHIIDSSHEGVEILARGFNGIEFETKLFDNAINLAINEIDSLIKQFDRLEEPTLQIFAVQKAMLKDPEFKRKVYSEIKNTKKSAPRVVAFFMDEYIKKFSSFESRILREKVQDIKDLRDNLLRHMGEKVTLLEPEFQEEQMVIVAYDLTPQETAKIDTSKVVAIVTEKGSEYSHAAIMAKSLQLPAVVGVDGIIDIVKPGDIVLVDGKSGFVYINPDAELNKEYTKKSKATKKKYTEIKRVIKKSFQKKPNLLRKISIDANIGLPNEIEKADNEGILTVGLLRTEFFYMRQKFWPDEEVQCDYYAHILKSFPKGDVTIRLLDIGGDKTLSYIPYLEDMNSHFGLRSIRLLLDHPEILKSQLKAIHMASLKTGRNPKILLPMVTYSWEIKAVREAVTEVTGGLSYQIGAMLEIPAAIFQVEEIAEEADFISIGTNDLIQYLLAVDRNNSKVEHLYNPLNISIIRALDYLMKSLNSLSKDFSVCGEMAGDPACALALLILGCRRISITPTSAANIRYMLMMVPENILSRLRKPLMNSESSKGSRKMLQKVITQYAPLLV